MVWCSDTGKSARANEIEAQDLEGKQTDTHHLTVGITKPSVDQRRIVDARYHLMKYET